MPREDSSTDEAGLADDVSRRRFLTAAGASGVTVLAGCGGDGSSSPTETDTTTGGSSPTTTSSPTPTASSTETDTDRDESPEGVGVDAKTVVEPFAVSGGSRKRIEADLTSEWSEDVERIKAVDSVTMSRYARVRPQCLVVRGNGSLAMLYSSESSKPEVTINTCLAYSSDAGTTWRDDPTNPVLNRIESHWQGRRAFGTGLGWDPENDRWVMASVGDQAGEGTPGIRAAGLWFSEDLTEWTQYGDNPVITAETDPDGQERVLPDPSIAVGTYIRHLQRIEGTWHALVNWRLRPDNEFTGNQHPDRFYRQFVMESEGDVTGPWKLRNRSFDPEAEPEWITPGTQLSQPLFVDGRWYGAVAVESNRVGFVYSEEYRSWHAVGQEAVTPPLERAFGSRTFNPSQQFILPRGEDTPWRGISGARGTSGDKYAYLIRHA